MSDPVTTTTQKSYTLLEVMNSVTSMMKKHYDSKKFWVRCELVKLNLHQASGHCYLELVDRNESTMVAQCRGIIWADYYRIIQNKFRSAIHSELTSGMKVMFECSVTFHSIHGFSLFVTDVEPVFTLGEMARMKNESIKKLKSEKLFDLNKSRTLPLLPKRIAVISVETSRGYQDFISTIDQFRKKFFLELTLFEATLQGDNAVTTISRALENIGKRINEFDVVTIIRGGAGDTGLACYDEFDLAKNVAAFPIPVVTGIGHATNETVTEMVAFKNCITPTAAANFFLEKFALQDDNINQLTDTLCTFAPFLIRENKDELNNLIEDFSSSCKTVMEKNTMDIKSTLDLLLKFGKRFLSDEKLSLQNLVSSIKHLPGRQLFDRSKVNLDFISKQLFFNAMNEIQLQKNELNENVKGVRSAKLKIKDGIQSLELLESKVKMLDPVNILARGYSITRKNGLAITSVSEILENDVIETTLADGKFIGTITEIKK